MYARAALFTFASILFGLGLLPAAGVAQNSGVQYAYGVTNQTHLGAWVTLNNAHCKLDVPCRNYTEWVPAGQQVWIKVVGIPGEFNLKAEFMHNRSEVRPVAVATIQWKLWPGSKDRLVERNGKYVWTP
ncbi:MAG TPA: hypothetical protein VMF11_14900 [Candidatus Baltobacteraceae bacterium]|nr:hypothetical protein [Candidatus Baltobacteraceae bacterium]